MNKQFTVAMAYALRSYSSVTVEADTVAEACEKALHEPDFGKFQDDGEGSSIVFVEGVAEGEDEEIMHGAPDFMVGVPEELREAAAVAPWAGIKSMPLGLGVLVQEMLDYQRAQFDGEPDVDLSVSGADLVDEWTEWRTRLKSIVGGEADPVYGPLLDALKAAAVRFREYEGHHNKAAEEHKAGDRHRAWEMADEKARRNGEIAKRCENVLDVYSSYGMHPAGRKPLSQFQNRLKILRSIDRHELVEAGFPVETETWAAFQRNPYEFLMSCGDPAESAIWTVITNRGG